MSTATIAAHSSDHTSDHTFVPSSTHAGPLTIPFHAINAADLPLVGGKGANLGEMTQAALPVPPGFCVTTDAFRAFLDASGRTDEIYRALAAIPPQDIQTARQVGEQVRAWLREVEVPSDIATAITTAWHTFGTNHSYAVRSSATAEDLPGASFAGQQDTYLHVTTEAALIESVRACWISLFTDRAILYRAQNGFDHQSVYLAVVVQQMILPDISGILFTADPVTGHRHIISIDASYGLGEALVAGLVTPDLYKVDKRTRQVVHTQVNEKHLAIRPKPDGGTYQAAITGEARTARVLSDAQIVALADLGTRIESHYGAPQDIEWCMVNDEIFIVQSRPITSLFPLPEPRPIDPTLHVYFSFSHAQVMTDPMPPMAVSFWRMIMPFGKQNRRQTYTPALTTAAGRIYVDVTPLLRLPHIGRNVPNILQIADSLSARAIRDLINRRDFTQDDNQGHARLTTLLRRILPIIAQAIARVWLLPPEGATARLAAKIEAYDQSVARRLAAAAAGAARLKIAQQLLLDIFPRHIMQMPPYLIAGIIARALLMRLLGGTARHTQLDADLANDIDAVGRGLSGNVTTEMDLQVGDLADAARHSPTLVAQLSRGEPQQALANAADLPDAAPFRTAWARFIQQYGMRGPSEIDISRPAWAEQPDSLLQVVIANLQHTEPGAHRAHHAQLAAAGEAAATRLVAAARRGPLGFLRAPIVRRLTRVMRNLLPMREHPKYMMIRLRGRIRTVILECAAILHEQGRLTAPEDVWFLKWHELDAALQDRAYPLHDLIANRQQALLRAWQIVPPRVITSDGEIPTVNHDHSALPDGALAGSPVSGGTVEGIAKVITDPQREMLKPGEILVAPFTDPGWTPLFINAAGLVMETGGLMTHGSVVAREYGIPAVVAVIDATKRIQTGQRIRVDGSAGYVEILTD